MKTLLYFALGIMLGIVTFNFGLSMIRAILVLNITGVVIDGIITWILGLLTVKCFNKI